MEPGDLAKRRAPSVFVFNPFAEGYIAHGKAFAPVKHQAMLAEPVPPCERAVVMSHNDVNPTNIIYDGVRAECAAR